MASLWDEWYNGDGSLTITFRKLAKDNGNVVCENMSLALDGHKEGAATSMCVCVGGGDIMCLFTH